MHFEIPFLVGLEEKLFGRDDDFFSEYQSPLTEGLRPVRYIFRQWRKMPDLDKLWGVKTLLENIWDVAVAIKNIVVHLISGGFFNDIFKAVGSASSAFGNGNGSARNVVSIFDKAALACRWIGLLSISSVPFTVFGIVKKSYYIVGGHYDRIDNLLEIIKAVGGVLEGVAGFASGLASVGLVSAASVTFATPLSIIGAVLGGVGQIIALRSFVQTYKFATKFDDRCGWKADGTVTDEAFDRILSFLIVQSSMSKKRKDNKLYLLGKHFNMNGKMLNKKLIDLRNCSADFDSKAKTDIVKTLRGRITQKQFSSALLFLSSFVEFIAFPILVLTPILCPPVMPLGFFCVVLGSSIAIAGFGIDCVLEYRFNRSLSKYIV